MMINKATSPYLFLLLFFIFQFLPSLAFAEATTIDPHSKNIAIHTFGGGELLEKVFNAVSMLIYGNSTSGLGKTFHSIIRIALVIGGFSVACLAFFREKFEPIIRSFFLPSLGITSFLLVPRTDVLIQDHLIQKTRSTEFSALIKVENVPFFLGKFVTLVSTLSYQITDALEGVTHGVNDNLYNWTGHIYAGDNLLKSKKNRIANRVLENNFREFCRECAWRDVGLGLYSRDDLANSKNLLTFLKDNTSKIRTMRYQELKDSGKDNTHPTLGTYLTCHEAMSKMYNLFNPRINKQIHKLIPSDLGNTKEILFGEFGGDIGFLLDKSKKSKSEIDNLIKQQLAIDFLQEEMPGTLSSFASKRAEVQQRENQKILGALGASSIVAMRNFFEAIVYMVFPLIIIISLVSFGIKPILSWIQFVMWVNIWPPFYVVVNFLLNSIWNYRKTQAFGSKVDLTLFTSEGLIDLYSSMESIAAIAMAFIPYLSWALIKGGVGQMVHLASSLMAPAQSAAGSAAAEQTSGNYSLGNVSLGNTSAHNYDSFRQTHSKHLAQGGITIDQGTNSTTYVPDKNQMYIKQNDSHLREGISKTESFQTSLQDQMVSGETAIQEQSMNVSSSIADTANKASGYVEAVSHNVQTGQNFNQQEMTSTQKTYQDMVNLTDEYANSHNVSKDVAVKEMVEIGLSGGLAASMFGVKGGLQGSINEGVTKASSESYAQKASQSEQMMELLQKSNSFSKADVAHEMNSSDIRAHEDFSQSWNQTKNSMEQLRASHSSQESLSHIDSMSKSENLSTHQKLDQRFVDYLSHEFQEDHGKITEILELPSNNPQKSELVEGFIHSMKTDWSNDHSIQSSYNTYANTVKEGNFNHMDAAPFDGAQVQSITNHLQDSPTSMKNSESTSLQTPSHIQQNYNELKQKLPNENQKGEYDDLLEKGVTKYNQQSASIQTSTDRNIFRHAIDNMVLPNTAGPAAKLLNKIIPEKPIKTTDEHTSENNNIDNDQKPIIPPLNTAGPSLPKISSVVPQKSSNSQEQTIKTQNPDWNIRNQFAQGKAIHFEQHPSAQKNNQNTDSKT